MPYPVANIDQHGPFNLLLSFYSYQELLFSSSAMLLLVSYLLLLQIYLIYLYKKYPYSMDVKIPTNPVLVNLMHLSLAQEEKALSPPPLLFPYVSYSLH